MEKTITKVYVDNEGFVVFVCSKCNLIQKQEAKTYGGAKGPIQVQCTCGNVYDVEIEFRKFYRKGIRVDGLYFGVTNPKIWGKMVLKNVSMQGCGFETMGANP
ncbi:MAG TPA: hypothetical protein PLR47_02785, partial [Smithellaceae bacterium]|nr:hypothetical protein [Smithellaceae bacterium]